MKTHLNKFLEIYEKHLSTLMFVGGFALDNILMKRVDLWWDDVLLISYLVIVALSILFINIQEEGRVVNKVLKSVHPWFLFAMQFALGGLFSSFFVFYSRSATLAEGWPFLLVLVSYMLANEFLKRRYSRLNAQVSAFFVALFSFSILFIPVVIHKMGDWVFLLSGVVSLSIISLFIKLLFTLVPKRASQSKKTLLWTISLIFCVINILYFTRLIPPVPLALKESGVYHNIVKNTDGTYLLDGDSQTWWNFFQPQVFKISEGGSVYVLSSIFGPTNLNVQVVHVWQNYDAVKKTWITRGKINLPISGGRDGGYRTYSMKNSVFPGLWRVDIETKTGQLIGREKFKVEIVK